ncbi:MAG: DUF1772 domain-containing protein [Bacteroidota bacterium]
MIKSMETNMQLIVLLLGILCTGLTAGLCFTWSNAVTPGIGQLDDLTFLKSFQAMNQAILNQSFFVVFFSPALLLFLNAFLHRSANRTTFVAFLAAAVLFALGVGLITIFKNVPLNDILENSVLESLSVKELRKLRKQFEGPWNAWHMGRTISSFVSFVLLLIGLVYNG